MAKGKEENQQEEVAQQPQVPQPRPCPQDCRQCNSAQQLFCTTKMLFDLYRSQLILRDQMKELSQTVGILKDQLQPKEQKGELSIPFTE